MTALTDLLIAQLGVEIDSDTYGCDVAPTVKLMGIDSFQIVPNKRDVQVGDKRGTLAPSHKAIRTCEDATVNFGGLLNYEDVNYWLSGLFGSALTTDAGGCTTDADSIKRVYNAPLITFDTDLGNPAEYTLVYGEADSTSDGPTGVCGCIMNNLSLVFETCEPARFTATAFGKKAFDDELVPATDAADRDVVFVMGDHCTLCIDPASDGDATTTVSSTAFRIELNINANRQLVRHLGSQYPDGYKNRKWTGTMRLILEMNTTSRAYYDALLAATAPTEYSVNLTATTGSAATERILEIDFSGVVMGTPVAHTDMDGIVTVELNLEGQYNAALGNWLIVNTTVGL